MKRPIMVCSLVPIRYRSSPSILYIICLLYTSGLVALKVGQADEHIGVHNGPADLGGLAVFAVGHRYLHLSLIHISRIIKTDK